MNLKQAVDNIDRAKVARDNAEQADRRAESDLRMARTMCQQTRKLRLNTESEFDIAQAALLDAARKASESEEPAPETSKAPAG